MNKNIWGGKARALHNLTLEGFPIPPFISIHADRLDSAADQSEGFTQLATAIIQENLDFFSQNADLYAVRSSAELEDSADFSMAGLFTSEMNVSQASLAEALQNCWAAGQSRHIREYLALNGAASNRLHLIIQAMVSEQSHAAILFTANPDGLLNERVLVIAGGSGSELVNDQSQAITYYRHASEAIGYIENPYGLEALSPQIINKIWSIAEAIEAKFGHALDLELALDKHGQIHLLQMRPITTLDRSRLDQPGTILDNSNIVESYPGLTLPLSTDFYHQAYQGVFSGLMKRLLPMRSPDVDARLNEISQNMVASWNGRAYYRLHNWLGLLAHLPFQKRIIPVWQEMMGVTALGLERPPAMLGLMKRLGIGLRFTIEIKELDKNYEALKTAVEEVEAEFRTLRQKPTAPLLYELFFERIRERLLTHWDVTLINDLVAMVWTGRVKKLAIHEEGQDPHSLISGFTALESMKPLLSLNALRRGSDAMPEHVLDIASRDHFVAKMVIAGEHPSMQTESAKAYVQALQLHVRLYGDRSVEELKLESPTQRSHPERLFRLIKESDTVSAQESESQIGELEDGRSSDTERPKSYRKALARARRAIERREESRLLRTRVYGMVRTIFLDLATRFVEHELIDEEQDIFWLQIEEVFAAVRGHEDLNYRGRISERKAEYAIWSELPAYSRLLFEAEAFSKHKAGQATEDELNEQSSYQGLGSSSGLAEAEVLVVHNIHEVEDARGKILVCRNTDPGWVYLIMQAKGIIAEQGSVLSHTAIIARELAVPAVVGLSQATRLFKSGERVRIDGQTGRVSRINRDEAEN